MSIRTAAYAALLVLLGLSSMARAVELNVVWNDNPPFNYLVDGVPRGVSVERVERAMKLADVPYRLILLPWQRAYSTALSDPSTCVFSTTLIDERKPLFKWVGPLVENDFVFFVRSNSPIRIKSLDDARHYRIGSTQGHSVSVFLENRGFTLDTTSSQEVNAIKLAAGRIDLWAAGYLQGRFAAARAERTDIKVAYKIQDTIMYLACNPAVPDDLIDRLNDAMAKVIAAE